MISLLVNALFGKVVDTYATFGERVRLELRRSESIRSAKIRGAGFCRFPLFCKFFLHFGAKMWRANRKNPIYPNAVTTKFKPKLTC